MLFLQHYDLQAILQEELRKTVSADSNFALSNGYFSALDQKIEELKQTNLQLESKADDLFPKIKQTLLLSSPQQEIVHKIENQADKT